MIRGWMTWRRLALITGAVLIAGVLVGIRVVKNRIAAYDAARKAAFASRFEASFNSGDAELIGRPQIKSVNRYVLLGIGSGQPPGVNEYVVTAQFRRDGEVKWGRWRYTCNGGQGDGIYKYSHAEAAQQGALPLSLLPRHRYIPWATEMVDGIPSTAGASASNVSVTPVAANRQITVSASAPAGTTCRIQVFPPDALLSPVQPQQPDASGAVTWACTVNPRYAGGRIRLLVNCQEPIGAMVLENSTEAPNVEIPAH